MECTKDKNFPLRISIGMELFLQRWATNYFFFILLTTAELQYFKLFENTSSSYGNHRYIVECNLK